MILFKQQAYYIDNKNKSYKCVVFETALIKIEKTITDDLINKLII